MVTELTQQTPRLQANFLNDVFCWKKTSVLTSYANKNVIVCTVQKGCLEFLFNVVLYSTVHYRHNREDAH